jgi:DNA polymerase-3 subunit gamma/tau
VKFIFATTEVHKVPITILSRCQRYDFKLIAATTVAKRLETVLEAEGISADSGAVSILAREASGSMRDAMSLLDQVVAYAGSELKEADVARVLGVADRSVLHELSSAVLDGHADNALTIVHSLANEGYDVAQVCRDFLRHLRNLVVARVAGASAKALLDLPDAELADVQTVAARHDADDLTRCYQGFSKSFDDIVRSASARAALEMALIRLARRPPLLPLDDLLQRLGDLERRLGGAPSRATGRGPSPSSTAHIRNDFENPASMRESVPRFEVVPGGRAPIGSGFEGALATTTPAIVTERPALRAIETQVVAPPAPEPPRPRRALSREDEWPAVIDELRRSAPAVAALYEHAMHVNDGRSGLTIAFAPDDFLGERGMQAASVRELQAAARRVLGPETSVEILLEAREGESLAVKGERERQERIADARRAITEDPAVRALIDRFGATIRDEMSSVPRGGHRLRTSEDRT